MKRWKVSKKQKLVAFLQKNIGESGKKIRRMLEANSCRVNGSVERFGSIWLKPGDAVEFFPNEKVWKHFSILYENEHLKVVDKPAGWICDPINCKRSFGPEVFLVHRLDKDTTGALLLAKNSQARDELMELFADRSVEKDYLALVDGVLREEEGLRESRLARKKSFQGQTIWGSSLKGDLAITRWKALARGERASLILCQPLTGRTHQLRVHLFEMGHPIVVDRQYAQTFRSNYFAARTLLHAKRLKFIFREEKIEVFSPIPSDLQEGVYQNNLKCQEIRPKGFSEIDMGNGSFAI